MLKKWPKGQLVAGVSFGLEIFGKGPGELAKGEVKAAKLVLHVAFLKNARAETKEKAKFEQFASLSGKLQLKGGKPVFTLEATGKFEYSKPEPASGKFRRIRVSYEKPAFEGAPLPPAPKPNQQPPAPHPLSFLRLPEEPAGMQYLMVGAELEIGGAKSSDTKQNDVLDVPLSRIDLRIVKVDPHFAPSTENLDIKYNTSGLLGSEVTLEITGKSYPNNPLLKRVLTEAELSDGLNTLGWDGKCNAAAGPLKDQFLNPLFGPYEVKLSDGAKRETKATFKVLYQGLELSEGSHTPDGKLPPESETIRFAQAKLNALGYDAGPVNGTDGPTLKKAVKRFQRANYKVGTQTRLTESGSVDADTKAALKSASVRARFETGKKPLTEDCKLYVHDNYFNDHGEDFVSSTLPEFNSMDRKRHVEDKLERPYLPLEVSVKLLSKAGQGVVAKLATGAVPVAWEADDAPEDASIVPAAANARARTYVERARKVGTSPSASGARVDQSGDNALKAREGYRETAAADYVKAWFPNSADSELVPYKVTGYGQEKRGAVTFHRALVKVWDHATDHPERRGRAGVYFRHSNKGGDDAKVRASLTFEGLGNKADLEKLHGWKTAPFAETGRWTVWRRARLNAYCEQTAPSRKSGAPNWGTINAWWRQAFIEMENNGQPAAILSYGTVVPEAVFKKAIAGLPAGTRPAGVTTEASVTYRAGSMYGGRTITQNPGESAAAFVHRATSTMRGWVKHPINAILGVIHDHVRKTAPEGLVVFDFRIHDPFTAQDWDPSLNGGAGGFKPATNPAVKNVLSSTSGYVRLGGAVTMNVDNPFNVNCYLLHECGHARFLYHHKTGGGGAGNASDNPSHHDADQERCAMSYGIGADAPDAWRYPFCGKCLLRLRGWEIAGLPIKYTP
jgi:hypothetical protein